MSAPVICRTNVRMLIGRGVPSVSNARLAASANWRTTPGPCCCRRCCVCERSYDVTERVVSPSARPPATSTGTSRRTTSRSLSDRNIVGHLVSDAPHGHHRAGVADLAAQLPNVHVDGARVARERVAPHPLEELVARQHDAVVLHQGVEQVELL